MAALAALAAAAWLRHPIIPYLVAGGAATGAAGWMASRAAVHPVRAWRLATAAAAGLFYIHASFAQYELWRLAKRWPAYEARTIARATDEMRQAMEDAARELTANSRSALALGDDAQTFERLERMTGGVGERAVIVYSGGEPTAWAGTTRVPTDTLVHALGVAQTSFYTVLYATSREGSRRAIATALMAASPPADSLARALDRAVADRSGARAYGFLLARDASQGAGLALSEGGQLLVRPLRLSQPEALLEAGETARLWGLRLLGALLACVVAGSWIGRDMRSRLLALGVSVMAVALVPLNALSNTTPLFDPSHYFTPRGGPFTSSIGALAITSGLLLLALLGAVRWHAPTRHRWLAALVALVVVVGSPFLLRALASGIAPPPGGVPASLWLGWQISLFLAATSVLLLGALAGRLAVGGRGLPAGLGPAIAALAALLAPVLWDAPGNWPPWYFALWTGAAAALVFSRRSRGVVPAAAVIAGLGAMTLVWGATTRHRVQQAERDVLTLSSPDPVAAQLLERFGADIAQAGTPLSRAELLQRYAASDLAAGDYPVSLAAWSPTDEVIARLALGMDDEIPSGVRGLVSEARQTGRPVIGSVAGSVGAQSAVAVPSPDGYVTTAAAGPRGQLLAADPYTALLGGRKPPSAEPPYTLVIADVGPRPPALDDEPSWRRRGDELHGDWITRLPTGAVLAHVEVELRPLDALVQRGTLVLLLDLTVLGALWGLSALADGGMQRWMRARRRRWSHSYRLQLTLALFTFFVVPAAAFTLWSSRRLTEDDVQSRELLVRETLRAAGTPSTTEALSEAADRVGAPLLLYLDGRLQAASDPLYAVLAPFGRFLPPAVAQLFDEGGEPSTSHVENVGGTPALVGYRLLPWEGAQTILAAPARTSDLALDRRRRDFTVLMLFATVVGALAAFGLSGLAARQLARPIGSLRRAALSIARGEREPELASEPPWEFQPVFSAFRRMAADLDASRDALEQARASTAAVLRDVASGVVAMGAGGRVVLANPAAERLLNGPLRSGDALPATLPEMLQIRIRELLAAGIREEEVELELGGRQLHARLTPLQHGGGGLVLTLDDVTEIGRAQRVIAWGEMARQIAHEIKNPLTPIRLGVQHLRRAYAGGRGDFGEILDQNVGRILAEIGRLDEIARAFSRYGTAPEERAPGEPTDVSHVARDVVELERLGEDTVRWTLAAPEGGATAIARDDELREVLLNVLENARLAGARAVDVMVQPENGVVRIMIQDDGHGIPAETLPRIFEPHFSTRTSGSGLGLAISRRLVEGWGGTMEVSSEVERGTLVVVTLASIGDGDAR